MTIDCCDYEKEVKQLLEQLKHSLANECPCCQVVNSVCAVRSEQITCWDLHHVSATQLFE
jgi:hypothetical protein